MAEKEPKARIAGLNYDYVNRTISSTVTIEQSDPAQMANTISVQLYGIEANNPKEAVKAALQEAAKAF